MVATHSDPRSSRAWRALCARARVQLPSLCWLCGEHIDQTLHHNHPRAWTLDHVVPVVDSLERALDETNVRPAHRDCNSRRAARGAPPSAVLSRRW